MDCSVNLKIIPYHLNIFKTNAKTIEEYTNKETWFTYLTFIIVLFGTISFTYYYSIENHTELVYENNINQLQKNSFCTNDNMHYSACRCLHTNHSSLFSCDNTINCNKYSCHGWKKLACYKIIHKYMSYIGGFINAVLWIFIIIHICTLQKNINQIKDLITELENLENTSNDKINNNEIDNKVYEININKLDNTTLN